MQPPSTLKILYALLIGAAVWFGAGYLLPLVLPLLLGAALALAAEPMVKMLVTRLHLPRNPAAALSVSAVWVLSAAAVLLLLGLLARQMPALSNLLPQAEESISQSLQQLQHLMAALTTRLPGAIGAAASDLVAALFTDSSALLGQAAQHLPQLAGGLLKGLSNGLFCVVTGVICGYMLSARLPKLRLWLSKKLPGSWRERYHPLLKDLRRALFGWIRAELKLAGIAFGFLLVGFWLLRLENAFLIATLVTLVDAFPVLGVGTVLIPWSLICLLQSQTARGVGLLGLYMVIWLVRSALEPKLVGKNIGLDPLVTLASIYIGFRLWGVAGMLLAPILALTATQTVKQMKL